MTSVAAVVVTYYPDRTVLDNLRRLSSQAVKVVVVDNGSGEVSLPVIDAIRTMAGIELICNGSNMGIAAALNIGIRHVLQSGYQWIATFDQDSAIPENFFDQLFRIYDACPDARTVGMIVPGGWAEAGTPVKIKVAEQPSWSFVRGGISSGSVIKAKVFPVAGFYDDQLFIDYVDTDFCLRLIKKRFKILSANVVILEHELGTKQTCCCLGFTFSFRIHKAWRYYYIMRNRQLLYRRHLVAFPFYCGRDALWMLLEFGRIVCLEHGRATKFSAAWRGVMDGWRGKSGRHIDFPKP